MKKITGRLVGTHQAEDKLSQLAISCSLKTSVAQDQTALVVALLSGN